MPQFLTNINIAPRGGEAITGADLRPRIVTEHGAIGDGLTDDAPAIQALLDEVYADGGGILIFPPGTYALKTLPLRVYTNTRLSGMAGAVLRRDVNGTMLLNGDATQNFPGWTGHSNITLEGLTLDMNAAAFGNYNMCVSIGHARNITIRDCTMLDIPGYHAIELNSTKGALIENCRFLGFYALPGERDFSEAVQFDLAKGNSYFGGFGPYDHTPCEDITMRGCYVGASEEQPAWPRGVGSHSATIGRWHSRIRLVGNSFENTTSWAVSTYGWRDTIISGNQIQSCAGGIRVQPPDPGDANDTLDTTGTQTGASQDCEVFVIEGNTIRGTTGAAGEGVYVYGFPTGRLLDVVVDGNVMHNVNASENGIRLEYVDRFTCSGNNLKDIEGTAISQQFNNYGTIANNTVHTTTTGTGISVIDCDYQTITGNQLAWVGLNGIHLQDSKEVLIAANQILFPARDTLQTGYGIRCTTSCDGVLIQGNRVRNYVSGGVAVYGCSITSTCSNFRLQDNDLVGSGSTSALQDQTTPAVTGKSGGNWLT